MRALLKCTAAAGCMLAGTLAAQQDVPMRNGIPVAPTGLVVPALPDAPKIYDTAEGQTIRVVVLARGLDHPWSIAFLPNGDKLVTEISGKLRLIRGDDLVAEAVAGVPAVIAGGISSGLFDLALHPDFAANGLLYFTYTKPNPDGGGQLTLARGHWDGNRLESVEDLFQTRGGSSRIVFGRDGMIYMSAGGSVLRLTPAGKAPADNPFVDDPEQAPETFTTGHRSTIGLAVHPLTGEIWQNENGPNGGDEINILKPGANYGWPEVSLGRTYQGPWQSDRFQRDGVEDPVVYWMPAIAVSGMAFYTGDALSRWQGDVFVGGLRMGEIPGTGHLERILFNQDMQELRREMLLVDLRQRIRDVRMGPDELLYVLTDEDDGAVLRIEPAD